MSALYRASVAWWIGLTLGLVGTWHHDTFRVATGCFCLLLDLCARRRTDTPARPEVLP